MASMRRALRRREIAQRVRKKRMDLGLSQEAAAKRLGIDRVSWGYIETGKQSIPSERLVDVARALETTTVELLGMAA